MEGWGVSEGEKMDVDREFFASWMYIEVFGLDGCCARM